jgi:hypothetical protein
MKIAEIRTVIDTANWNRRDLGGSTREEFIRCNVAKRLAGQIEHMKALDIPARFARDIERRAEEIAYCEAVIERWLSMQPAAASASTAVN